MPGEQYEVIAEFEDFDGGIHRVGDRWTFLGCSFLPYDGGLSLFVSYDGEQEWHIRMQEVRQHEILADLGAYIAAV